MVKKKKKTKTTPKKAPKSKGKKMTSTTKKTKKVAKKTTKKTSKKTAKAKKPAAPKRKTAAKTKTTTRKTAASNPAAGKSKPTKKKAPVKSAKKVKAPKSSLKPSELKEIRNQLFMKRALILGDLSKMEDSALRASEQDSSTDNMADYGTDNYEQDFTLGLIENVEAVVKEIDDALKRVDEKTFGICQRCQCVIPKARLKALPYARHCVQCQSDLEQLN